MIKKICFLFLLVSFFHLVGNNAFAKDITLAWDASTDADVAGYHVYYKVNSSSQPFDSTDAIEGDSPIDVGNQLTTTLTGLPDGAGRLFRGYRLQFRGAGKLLLQRGRQRMGTATELPGEWRCCRPE